MVYAERPAFLQFFQIIMLIISLGLQSASYSVDISWQRTLQKVGKHHVCLFLTKYVNMAKYNEYLARMKEQGISPDTDDQNPDRLYFLNNISRGSGEEQAALVLISVSIILLVTHLGLACISKNNTYRTKWTAAVQGIVLFATAFASVFIAISAYNYRTLYHDIATKFHECVLLHCCINNGYKNKTLSEEFLERNEFTDIKKSADRLAKTLEENYVCQEFDLKTVAAAITGIMLIFNFVIMCFAMDLTTLYNDEDIDEEERRRRQDFHRHALHAKRRMHSKSQMSFSHDEEDLEKPQAFKTTGTRAKNKSTV